jgi:hypothetical protein
METTLSSGHRRTEMTSDGNVETVQGDNLNAIDLSNEVFRSLMMTDFNNQSTRAVVNDIPLAFQGGGDSEIVDNEMGKSLTGRQPSDEAPDGAVPEALESGKSETIGSPAQTEAPKSDPRFAKMSDGDLERNILKKSRDLQFAEEVISMYKELISRYDAALTKADYEASIPSMKLLTEALKQGKDIKDGPNGTLILGGEALTPDRRWLFHGAVFGDMEAMNNQIRARQEFAQFLKACGQFKDAEATGLEARDLAEQLVKPRQVDGQNVRIVDLMSQEASKLLEDMNQITDPIKRQEMQKAHIVLNGRDVDSGAIKTAINTNLFLAYFYLGTEIIPKLNSTGEIEGIQEIKFGQSSAFNPQLAIEPANRVLALTRDILKVDPLNPETAEGNPYVALLFAHILECLINDGAIRSKTSR